MARRFVTYNTEDQAAGLVNVDERGVMLPGGGSAVGDSTERIVLSFTGVTEEFDSEHPYIPNISHEKCLSAIYQNKLELGNIYITVADDSMRYVYSYPIEQVSVMENNPDRDIKITYRNPIVDNTTYNLYLFGDNIVTNQEPGFIPV